MCTLTWIPQQKNYIVTSNRDEKMKRSHLSNMVVDDNDFAVILNGGKTSTKSRKDIVDNALNTPITDYTGYGAFTLITYENGKLLETKWDGHTKYFRNVNKEVADIWSSSTLYTEDQQRDRFLELLMWMDSKTKEDIFEYHQTVLKYKGDKEGIETLSTKQITVL